MAGEINPYILDYPECTLNKHSKNFSQPIHYLNSTTLWDGLKAKYILLLLESAEEYCFKWSGQ
jgi:hypothetical protein